MSSRPRMDENAAARLKRAILRVAYWIGLFLAMLVICLPGLWIVLSSLRPTVEIMAKPPVWIPQELSFDAYVAMFSGIGQGGIPVIEYFRNSLIISVTSTVIAIGFCTLTCAPRSSAAIVISACTGCGDSTSTMSRSSPRKRA